MKLIALGCWGALLVASHPAAAQTSPVEQAQRHYADLDFDQAIGVLQHTLEQGKNTPETMQRLYALLGQSLAVVGKEDQAQETFAKLLLLNPRYHLPEPSSPKIRHPFSRAASQAAEEKGLAMTYSSALNQPPERRVRVRVDILGDTLNLGHSVRFHYWAGHNAPTSITKKLPLKELAAKNSFVEFEVSIPHSQKDLLFHLELLDPWENTLLRQGSVGEPLRTTALLPASSLPSPLDATAKMEAAQGSPWYHSWWVWATVGAVVAGATAGAIWATRDSSSNVVIDWRVQTPQE